MPRKRTLIPSPLAWTSLTAPVPHPPLPVIPERGGTQLRTPLPTAIIDTRLLIGYFRSAARGPLPAKAAG